MDIQSARFRAALCYGNRTVTKERLVAHPIKRIVDVETNELVGWLYRWNTGEDAPMWMKGSRTKVRYEAADPR